VQQTAIRPFHVNVPGINFERSKDDDTNCHYSTKHRTGY